MSPGSRAMRIAMLALGLGAAFLIVQSGLAFMLAPSAPEIALRIDSQNGDVMASVADARFATAKLGSEADALTMFSRQTLARSPYQVVAMRNIGLITAAEGNEKAALKLVRIAARMSLRDYLTHAWLLDYLFRTDRIDESVREADITLKQRVETWDIIGPALVILTRDRRIVRPLARTLAARPYWRGMLLQRLGTDNPHPDASYAIYRRLKELGAPADSDELAPYFRSAMGKVPINQLYTEWLSLLPRGSEKTGSTLVHDGDFAGLAAPPPFNWQLFPDSDVYAERSTGPANMGSALYAGYTGNRQVTFASQLLVLTPGRYRMTGRGYADQAVGPGYFAWQLICNTPDRVTTLARRDLDLWPSAFTQYRLDFEIPAGCDQQRFELTGAPAGPISGTIAMYADQIAVTAIP